MTTRHSRFLVGILVGALLAIADATRAADNMVFVPLAPCRVIDTRVVGAGGPLVAGAPRTFFFRGPTRNYATSPNQGGNAAGCGIPDLTTDGPNEENLAKAVAINIVAVGPGGAGNLRAWPANQAMPTASLVNYSNANIANGVVVPMCDQVAATPCTSGDITFLASVSGADLVVDVTGYFHAGSTSLTLLNTALGHQALLSNTTGDRNTANGTYALQVNTTGSLNTANGTFALLSNTTGSFNTANGARALQNSTIGVHNTANGALALNNTTGDKNTATGSLALYNQTSGLYNVGLGYRAGVNLTTGSNNICIGNQGVAAESNTIRIGTEGTQTKAFVAGIRGITTANNNAIPVLIDSSGQLGTVSSSREVKQDIVALGATSERILGLRPVSFRYKEQAARGDTTPQFGLIADEVARVFSELVIYDKEGQPETVKYHVLPVLLLNELQRLQAELEEQRREAEERRRRSERQEAELAALRQRLERLEPGGRDGPSAPPRH